MHHTNAKTDWLHVKRKGGRSGVLQIEAKYRAEVINVVAYINTKYKELQFVNIIKTHDSNQPTKNSTTKRAAEGAEELNQTNESSDKKKVDMEHTKAGKQSNTYTLY